MRSFVAALVAGALLGAGAARGQGFAPIPQQAGPNVPPEARDYPVPAAPAPAPADAPAVPLPTVNYPGNAGQSPQSGAYRPPQSIAVPVIPAPPPAPRPQLAPPSGPTPVAPPPQIAPPQAGVQQAGLAPVTPPGPGQAGPSPPDAWLPRGGAELRALDKVNARSLTVSGRIGQIIRYATLTIVVRACVVRPPDQAADAAAFLEITDSRPNTPVFRGWMLANEPGLMVYEHPIYDVRLLGCRA